MLHIDIPDTLLHLAIALVYYVIGSARTYASLGYCSETIGQSLHTMRPWFGNPHLKG